MSLLLLTLACAPEDVIDDTLYLRTDGADLRLRAQGNRAADTFVLVVHGGPGGNGAEYNSGRYAERLESELVMVYYDQRGQGASTGNYDAADVTIQQLSDDTDAAVDLLRALYGDDISVYLMGHSWGGTLGTWALLHTDIQSKLSGWIEADGAHDIPRLNQLAIEMFIEVGGAEIDAGHYPNRWREIVRWAEGVDVDNITEEIGGEINRYAYDAEYLIDTITWDPDATVGALVGDTVRSGVSPLTSAWAGNTTSGLLLEDGVEEVALADRLDEVTIPTLLLWGRYDFVVPPALAEEAVDALGGDPVELVLFETSGHSPMSNQPDAYADEMLSFIEQTRTP
ncbi:MAG: alpha/beta hydrolase [Alphaproteobacteria bacterium]|nr:alpha/beta hydrolase [Alphaproteobacteria bacterium]